jgi:D-sedoheptulose 7-phosphate isomerase
VEGLGRPGDSLLVISTSGQSRNLIRAVEVAQQQGLRTLGLIGKDGGALRHLVEIPLLVPSFNTQRIQEVHIAIGHILCEALEHRALSGVVGAVAREDVSA